MRLMILCEYGTLNGGERSMLATLPGIARAGYDVCIAAPAAGPLAEVLRVRGVEVVPFEPSNSSGTRLDIEERRRRLAEIIGACRPDLLHANSLAMGRLAGPVAAELGVPSISHIRDIVGLSRQYVADLNQNHRLLAVSEATRRFHVAQGLVADKTSVLYNGVDNERFRPSVPNNYLQDELKLPHDCPLIATIGQISLRKGHDTVAAALALLPAKRPFAWLVIGERFSEKDESRQFESQLHRMAEGALANRLLFLGNRDDVDRILPELTLLVHSARQEPLGRVLLEAAAAGRAIVATDVGGTREIFPPECDAACVVPADDAPAMARAIGDLLNDPVRRSQLGVNARKRIGATFTVEQATAGLLSHYESVLSA
jgi:glycosyltransferase involved in cell wall biosynthesis